MTAPFPPSPFGVCERCGGPVPGRLVAGPADWLDRFICPPCLVAVDPDLTTSPDLNHELLQILKENP